MNIVITAGGTSEYIDSVRKITNSGSGKLGATIAEELSKRNNIDNIYYIHTPKAILPKGNKFTFIKVINTKDVEIAVKEILKNKKIDWFIHSMAISDYFVDYVSNINILVNNIKFCKMEGYYEISKITRKRFC